MGNDTTKCYFTGTDCLPVTPIFQIYGNVYNSQLCGQYRFFDEDRSFTDHFDKQKTACYLFYHKVTGPKCYLLIPFAAYEMYFESPDNSTYKWFADFTILTEKDIENWYPKNFAEKIDKILLKLYDLSAFEGDYVAVKEVMGLLFLAVPAKSNVICNGKEISVQCEFIINYLIDNNYVNSDSDKLQLKPKALERIYELQKKQTNIKTVFVAMSFHDSAKEIRHAIKDAILKANYLTTIMDEIVHNHQIVPEMLRLIKESRFLVMDITEPNLGAYYEAGYAQGLGKEVIITCREDVFNQKKFICEKVAKDEDKECKYKVIGTKPHFDIAQKQILVWKDADDLIKKLSEWIKYIIG